MGGKGGQEAGGGRGGVGGGGGELRFYTTREVLLGRMYGKLLEAWPGEGKVSAAREGF